MGVGDSDNLEENVLADKVARNEFVLFWKAMAKSEVKAFPCF